MSFSTCPITTYPTVTIHHHHLLNRTVCFALLPSQHTEPNVALTLTSCACVFCRLCFFTANSINRKSDFMKCLNSSYKAACLICSFTDTQVAEYIQFKKRGMPNLPKLYAVSYVGQQEDGSWVLSESAHISKTGQMLKVCILEVMCS